MLNFEFKNPTKIHFGKGLISKIADEIPAKSKVLMLYGGGSIKTNGVYEQVQAALKNFEVIEFGGTPANPEYDVLMKALSIIKSEKISYLLAVGGGSVIDGTKFLSSAALYDGENPWGYFTKRYSHRAWNAIWRGIDFASNRLRNEFRCGYF
jgi:NADP-dependent alcohol dehydrogenase